MTSETIKLAELIAQTVVQLATLGAIIYAVRLTFDYFNHRLDVTGTPIFERRDENDPSTV